jgi:hypothetical protein
VVVAAGAKGEKISQFARVGTSDGDGGGGGGGGGGGTTTDDDVLPLHRMDSLDDLHDPRPASGKTKKIGAAIPTMDKHDEGHNEDDSDDEEVKVLHEDGEDGTPVIPALRPRRRTRKPNTKQAALEEHIEL